MRASAIKGLDRYEHRVFTGHRDFRGNGFYLERRGSSCTLELADDFYVRAATSSAGWRVVLPDLGVTKIFTIDNTQYAELMKCSQPYEEEEE